MEQLLALVSGHVTILQTLLIFSLLYASNVPFVREIIDVTGMPLGEKKWPYACTLLATSSLKEKTYHSIA